MHRTKTTKPAASKPAPKEVLKWHTRYNGSIGVTYTDGSCEIFSSVKRAVAGIKLATEGR